jgi:DNA repair protein RadC
MENTIKNQKVSEVEIVYRNRVKASERIKIHKSNDCFELLKSYWEDKLDYCEQFYLLLLNRANIVLGVSKISEGGISGTVVDPKRIFQVTLKANASSIILCHNHPSGSLVPSEADRRLTRKIRDAGALLDITTLDHLIITSDGYYSFADQGEM